MQAHCDASNQMALAACRCNFFYAPLSRYRQLVFSKLLRPIADGAVLDIGCGNAGIYWAMGYAERVATISFLDCQRQQIAELETQLSVLTPEHLQDKFADTIEFLKPGLPIDKVSFAIAACLQEKIEDFLVEDITAVSYNFAKSSARKWRHVVALQSLQCLQSKEELNQALATISSLIDPSATFSGTLLGYEKVTPRVQELRKHKLEGFLQLDAFELEKILQRHHFELVMLCEQAFPEMGNYQKVLSFRAIYRGGNNATL